MPKSRVSKVKVVNGVKEIRIPKCICDIAKIHPGDTFLFTIEQLEKGKYCLVLYLMDKAKKDEL